MGCKVTTEFRVDCDAERCCKSVLAFFDKITPEIIEDLQARLGGSGWHIYDGLYFCPECIKEKKNYERVSP